MNKKVVILLMVIGSTIGSYVPIFFGVSSFSMTSVLCGVVGGIFGIWIGFKLIS